MSREKNNTKILFSNRGTKLKFSRDFSFVWENE